MSDSIFSICGKDFVIVAADKSVSRSILKIQDCDDKLTEITPTQILATCGEVSERKSFASLIKCNADLHYSKYHYELSTQEQAYSIRFDLAEALRKGAIPVNCLYAGLDKNEPSLFWIDYLGTVQKVTRGAQGYCAYFLLGLMDNYYKLVFK